MSQLTKTAKKTLVGLILGNLLIIFSLMQLGKYYYENIRSPLPPQAVRSLTHLVALLQKNPQSIWPLILRNQSISWAEITLSPQPLYTKNALLTLKAPIVHNLIKQNKNLEFSVFIRENTWLNIKVISLFPRQANSVVSVFLILIGALLFINYWAVRTLNQPIHTLIQSLHYSEHQDNWLPIPITGNQDQKTIFKKINDLQEKVNKLLANRTRVVTAISHDLRTPLTRLKLRAEYLADDPNYNKIMADINEMELMIRETLDYFRDVNVEEKPQLFDLVALLSSLKEDAEESNYNVSFTSDNSKLVYYGTVNLLKRAFNNLINNAVHYGFQAIIHLSCLQHKIEITITDQGPGLAEADLEQVFLPFYRGENSRSRSTGGTGLGLTIAREIIQMHQGDITLTNNLQGGLKVLVTLPIRHS
ncbi:HAMP domain-containing histidine kinase [Fluoribacter dumoffii]|uniref:histidine kinase n=1 Tax=Fluoribacter dumoffii TaxID=463 RepID=A0A377GCZ8_9GAMM|nr:HAMP domain-containing sensor histidine kinase [Fluoribacter dumoffii]KTC91021.1 sensor histidine kinase [Fluoribacter dumoffii NY 23]MCW8386590.1 HAMP domain-containing histidine kinase [Fluoribacter dumoffii]MCW8419644.1 HAMP domain-containing histidine kinase [Fluoribacter dumoffii]MCW8455653.1 HAMP domain-containing histidine kinase [Fluoribacter dumoffii]MCW8460268.1 HAMP domain-containing histidine kinase [Fluoribacter dumoffii]